jgi:hypothetical protein
MQNRPSEQIPKLELKKTISFAVPFTGAYVQTLSQNNRDQNLIIKPNYTSEQLKLIQEILKLQEENLKLLSNTARAMGGEIGLAEDLNLINDKYTVLTARFAINRAKLRLLQAELALTKLQASTWEQLAINAGKDIIISRDEVGKSIAEALAMKNERDRLLDENDLLKAVINVQKFIIDFNNSPLFQVTRNRIKSLADQGKFEEAQNLINLLYPQWSASIEIISDEPNAVEANDNDDSGFDFSQWVAGGDETRAKIIKIISGETPIENLTELEISEAVTILFNPLFAADQGFKMVREEAIKIFTNYLQVTNHQMISLLQDQEVLKRTIIDLCSQRRNLSNQLAFMTVQNVILNRRVEACQYLIKNITSTNPKAMIQLVSLEGSTVTMDMLNNQAMKLQSLLLNLFEKITMNRELNKDEEDLFKVNFNSDFKNLSIALETFTEGLTRAIKTYTLTNSLIISKKDRTETRFDYQHLLAQNYLALFKIDVYSVIQMYNLEKLFKLDNNQ